MTNKISFTTPVPGNPVQLRRHVQQRFRRQSLGRGPGQLRGQQLRQKYCRNLPSLQENPGYDLFRPFFGLEHRTFLERIHSGSDWAKRDNYKHIKLIESILNA